MKRLLTLCFATLLSGVTLAQAPDPKPGDFTQLEIEINEILQETKVVGMSIAVIDDFRVVWAKGFGVVEAGSTDSVHTNTLFQAASITKSFTAAAVLKAMEEGRIALDDDVNSQLTSWKIPQNEFTAQAPVTVKQLLSHTSGIPGMAFKPYTHTDALPAIGQVLRGEAPAGNSPVIVRDVPGKRYSYTGGGYAVLEQLLTDTEGRPFPQVIQRAVFDPLGLSGCTLDGIPSSASFPSVAKGHLKRNKPIPDGYYITVPASIGGLWATAADLAKFMADIQLSLRDGSGRVLSQGTVRLMVTPVTYVTHIPGGQTGLGFTLGKRGSRPFFGHDGHNLGYISSMLASLEGGVGLVILTNSENGWKAINRIKKLVGRRYWGI